PAVRGEEPPRIQLVRDAAAVGIAIIVVLLVGPMIFAGRTGGVLGETFAPDDAAALSAAPEPNAEAAPGSGPRAPRPRGGPPPPGFWPAGQPRASRHRRSHRRRPAPPIRTRR